MLKVQIHADAIKNVLNGLCVCTRVNPLNPPILINWIDKKPLCRLRPIINEPRHECSDNMNRTEQIVCLTKTIQFLVNHIILHNKSVMFHEYCAFICLLI